jgi:DNA-binding transcriptional regulator LsrR (DeoR family)
VTLPAAKAQIASQLNLTPEHFSRLLHELAQAGLLHVEGRKITVPNPDRLERRPMPSLRGPDFKSAVREP